MRKELGSSIKIATILSYLTLIIGNVISIFYTPFMLSHLGKSQHGVFSLVNTIISYVFLLDLGISNAIIRYNSKYLAENKEKELKNLNGMFLSMYFFISFISVIIGIIIYNNVGYIFSKGLTNTELSLMKKMIIIAFINIAVSFPLNVFNGIIMSREKFVYTKVIAMIRNVVNPIIMVAILLLGGKAFEILLASTIFNVIVGIINVKYCFKYLEVKFNLFFFKKDIFIEIFKYSFFILLSSIAYQIYWSTDQVILAMFVSATSISIYTIGGQFNNYFTSFSNVISNMFLPKLTKLVADNESNESIMRILIKVSRIQWYISSLILSGFICFGKGFINRWAGEGYESSYYIALIIMVPQMISIIQSLFATMLEAMNKHKIKSYIYLLVSVINLILSLLLVNYYGPIGCAMATCVGMILNAILNNIYYQKSVGLNMKGYWDNIIRLIPASLITLIIGCCITKVFNPISYTIIIVEIVVFVIIYFLLNWFMSFNDYEKNLLLSMFNRLYSILNKKSLST